MRTGRNRSKDERMLISAAETIGSTLGSLAARAEAAAKALGGRKLVKTAGQTAEQISKALNRGKVAARLRVKRTVGRKSRSTGARNRRTQTRRSRRSTRASAAKRRS